MGCIKFLYILMASILSSYAAFDYSAYSLHLDEINMHGFGECLVKRPVNTRATVTHV